jgi:hypothetical protein
MVQLRIASVIFACLLLLTSGPTWAEPLTCGELVKSVLKQRQLLERFSLSAIDETGEFRMIGNNDQLVVVPLKDGNKVAIRFEDEDPAFEDFASRFLSAAPGIHTPQVRKLNAKEFEPIDKLLRKKIPTLIDLSPRNPAEPIATVVPYFQATTGLKFLNQFPGTAFKWKYRRLADVLKKGKGNESWALKLLSAEWSKLDQATRAVTITDFRSAYPWLQNVSEEMFPEILIKNFRMVRTTSGHLYDYDFIWERLPPEMQRQLANHWAVYTLLGMPDFHATNWLIDGTDIIAIDLANLSKEFRKGVATLALFDQQTPLSGMGLTNKFRKQLIAAIDPELLRYLSRLKPTDIQKFAEKAHFDIEPRQVKGIHERIKKLLELRDIKS